MSLRALRSTSHRAGLPSLAALLASGVSVFGCAMEGDAPAVTPEPMRPSGSEAVVTPTPTPPPTPPPVLTIDEPNAVAGGMRPVTYLPPQPPPPAPSVVAHHRVRLPRR